MTLKGFKAITNFVLSQRLHGEQAYQAIKTGVSLVRACASRDADGTLSPLHSDGLRYFAHWFLPAPSTSMNREYFKEYSSELQRDMEVLIFGHSGTPLLVFLMSMGRFFEYEDRGMTSVLSRAVDAGELQIFCPDSVDTESWYNKGIHPWFE